MATQSSILAWIIPWMKDAGGLWSRGHKESDMTEATEHRQPHAPTKVNFLSSTEEARVYNGKKTTSLASGAGETGQPPVKE